ncbi:Ig-like domain-containing protein [Peptococcaceae bacterium 1198_IL3148]
MALQITFKQMRRFALTIVSLLMIWLVMGHFIWVKTTRVDPLEQVNVDCYFLTPMNVNTAINNFKITSEIPNDTVDYEYKWHSPFHLRVLISEKNKPQGIEYRYSFNKAKALIPPFTVSKKGAILTRVKPELITISPNKNAPTTGPILLQFNTPILKESMQQKVNCDAAGHFTPLKKNDYTCWQFIPSNPLQHQKSYQITIEAGLKGVHGLTSDSRKEITFSTAPKLIITDIYPLNGDQSVWLSRNIKLTANQPIKDAKITGIKGETIIDQNTVLFIPDRTFTPATNYNIKVTITSIYNETVEKTINYRTTDLGNKAWLEIKAGTPCQIWLMQGHQEIKKIEGWFTKDLAKLPRVTMYEAHRSNSTAKPWIRLNTDILIHSFPHTSEDNHHAIGLPQTYSCILLSPQVMDQLYATLSKGFMVIVH